jgi:hypothetical protein
MIMMVMETVLGVLMLTDRWTALGDLLAFSLLMGFFGAVGVSFAARYGCTELWPIRRFPDPTLGTGQHHGSPSGSRSDRGALSSCTRRGG